MKRTAGILMPITSLPGKYGIGCFSEEAYRFVDFLQESGQSWWQILPIHPTGFGDSPYQSFSTFAGNPYMIDLEALEAEGVLTKAECDCVFFGENDAEVDYEAQYNNRYPLLRKAYERSEIS
ncbi:MAG: 4-alpha-glucanotransferase, partial [Anaerotignum sp.]|nr:4-alpha-glucanotransferase [Anaerotignum sp.]